MVCPISWIPSCDAIDRQLILWMDGREDGWMCILYARIELKRGRDADMVAPA